MTASASASASPSTPAFAHPVDAARLLELLGTRPRVLALGEPTHGEDSLLDVRNTLFRQLVEKEGYRTVAVESDCLAGLLVDAYVTHSAPDGATESLDDALDDVMARGFSHGFGGSPANRALVRWMRAFNEGRPPEDRVRFAGLDGPLETAGGESPRRALTALHAHLAAHYDPAMLPCTARTLDELLGEDHRWNEPAALRDPSRSVGRTPEAERLRLITDDLKALLDALPAPREAATDRQARLYARTAAGLLRYHASMADPSPARLPRLLTLRDSLMAANLLALAARGPVLAHAHNSHLQRERSSMRMGERQVAWWGAGALVASRLGQEYAFAATAVGTLRHRGVQPPPPNTVEGLLYTLPAPHHLLNTHLLTTALGATPPPPRTSPWHGYAPLNPTHLPTTDALLFIKDTTEPTTPWWPTP
ncbi:erythromycin esterase family protein [Streptomyces sp. R302]|uniref:erythromycin esterase family protein n=1 Tax=Streptomyces sp. R302 TaxID=2728844 RepID=UPI00145E7A84|nr:erythromycin esterase family protein [Streptomyces sp. R302]NML79661.1 erythromycin esterase family protein [Streptomyces sp. R302]